MEPAFLATREIFCRKSFLENGPRYLKENCTLHVFASHKQSQILHRLGDISDFVTQNLEWWCFLIVDLFSFATILHKVSRPHWEHSTLKSASTIVWMDEDLSDIGCR